MNSQLIWTRFALAAALFVFAVEASGQGDVDLRERWRDPPPGFRLNRNLHSFPLEAAGQSALIEGAIEEGWGGFALNSPFPQYLTDAGLRATARFCELAKSRGLELWLYDEEGYPSGNAGGRVIRTNLEWEAKGLFFSEYLVQEGPCTVSLPPGKALQVAAFPFNGGEVDYRNGTDLRELCEGGSLTWNVPKGEWRIFAATEHSVYEGFQAERNPYPHPSPMVADATDSFLQTTHAKYAEYLGEDLGKYFTATFTDEPSSMALPFHRYVHRHAVIPWHPTLSREMEERFGYKVEEKLAELFYDEGPVGQQARYQYFKVVGDLISENYFGRVSNWCEKHGIRSGGHLLLEESMIAHVPLYGSIMQCFRRMGAPGIDILSCYPSNVPVHTPKLASSAAELMGHDRVMSEPCPVMDTPLEPPTESVRGFFNLLLQGGVTDFNCYLELEHANQSERVELNTYVGRVGMMLRGGHTAADIGVVYPIESMWTQYTPRYQKVSGWQHVVGAAQRVNDIDESFRRTSRALFERRWEYLHLDSQALIDCTVCNGQLLHGPLAFKVIILPSVDTLPIEAWSSLRSFVASGGKLVFLGAKPLNSDAHFPDATVQREFDLLIGSDANVVFHEDWQPDRLNDLLERWLERPVIITDEKLPVRLAHRKIDGRDVFFLVNDSPDKLTAVVTFRGQASMEEWNPSTAQIRSVPGTTEMTLNPYSAKIYRPADKVE